MTNIQLGTSSWNFSDWKGVFYPSSIPNAKMLSYYAGQFSTVEVNTSFYALPKPATLVNWVESVPDGFTFALKAPRSISHEKRLVDCRAEMLAYLDALRSLGLAAAPGLLQLPPSLSRQHDGRILADFIDWLAGILDGLQMSVEVRSPDLMTSAFANFLAEHGLSLVLVDREGTPDIYPIWREVIAKGTAPAFCLIRWIGDDKNGPKGNQERSAPREEALTQWGQRIGELWDAGIDVYGYMHNPYEGHSPSSVRRLVERLPKQIDVGAWPPEGWTGWEEESKQDSQLSLFDLDNQ